MSQRIFMLKMSDYSRRPQANPPALYLQLKPSLKGRLNLRRTLKSSMSSGLMLMGLFFLYSGDTHQLSGQVQWTDANQVHPLHGASVQVYADENDNQRLDAGESLIGQSETDANGHFTLSIQHGKSAVFAGEFQEFQQVLSIGFPDVNLPAEARLQGIFLQTENKSSGLHSLLMSSAQDPAREIHWEMIPGPEGIARSANLLGLFPKNELHGSIRLRSLYRQDPLPSIRSVHMVVHYRIPGKGYLISANDQPAQYFPYQSHPDIILQIPAPHASPNRRKERWGSLKVDHFDQKRLLEWMPSQQKAGDRFAVMRSEDGMNYETIAVFPAHEELNVYRFSDIEAVSDSVLAYQIRQDHTDGGSSFSSVIRWEAPSVQAAVDFLANYDLRQRQIICRYKSQNAAEVHLRLVNHTGQELIRQRLRVKQAVSEHVIPADKLPSGIYFLYIDWQDQSFIRKIILP